MLSIPIISEFDGKGIDKAIKEFKQLETVGQKAQFAIKKAAVPAAAALAGLGVALVAATKGAIEDEAEQAILALTLQNVTGATNAQVKATENMIAKMSRASGVADSELRPAFASLVRGTKDIATATDALALAQDISAGSGLSLASVSDALAAAYGGNMKALGALSPGIKAMIKDGASLDDVMNILGGTFGGAAADAADTAAGKFKILKNSLGETQESIGAALLPVVQAVLPYLQKFADWAENNPQAFLIIAGAIGAVAAAIVATNIAMALNPFSLIAAGIALLVVGLVVAYKKFEWFSTGVKAVVNGIIGVFEVWANSWIKVINAIIKGYNALPLLPNIDFISEIKLGRIGGDAPDAGGGINIPKMAAGGIVNGPTLAMIGEAGPEAVIPLSRMGQMGGGMSITVNAGLISTPDQIGQDIITAIQKAQRRSGQVFAAA
ncbi:MAG: hypothetical protein EBR82_32175 [Caulobacteraceae bacterium]|jgi:hypothetical protein|nr:hypothetical protein [Caulobacteraceae bacterium]